MSAKKICKRKYGSLGTIVEIKIAIAQSQRCGFSFLILEEVFFFFIYIFFQLFFCFVHMVIIMLPQDLKTDFYGECAQLIIAKWTLLVHNPYVSTVEIFYSSVHTIKKSTINVQKLKIVLNFCCRHL